MATFRYKAVRNGNVIEDIIEAADRFSVYRDVRKTGASIVSLEEVGEGRGSSLLSFATGFFKSVPATDKITFARNLAAMITAGLSLSRALAVIRRQSRNTVFKTTLASIEESIKKGGSLHDALAKFPDIFPALFTSMVKAGEGSGGLAQSLVTIASQLERMHLLAKRIRGALIYPAIVIVVMIGVAFIMLTYIVPTLASTFAELNVELPATTQAIIGLSHFLSSNLLLSLFILIGIALLPVALARSPRTKPFVDLVILKMPIIAPIVRETNAARTARTLSSLLSAGVEVVSALSIAEEVLQNTFYKRVLREAGAKVEKGVPISDAFAAHEDLYPPLVGEMIAVGEETGKLAGMLEQVAVFYENEVEMKTKNMSSIIEPFLMVIVGVGVGFFALAMISPIYSLGSGIS